MTYEVKPLSCDPKKLKGLSERLIVSHSMAGGTPILALDMYEHSYHIDYGAAASKDVDAFMDNINWANVVRLHEAHAR